MPLAAPAKTPKNRALKQIVELNRSLPELFFGALCRFRFLGRRLKRQINEPVVAAVQTMRHCLFVGLSVCFDVARRPAADAAQNK